MSNAKSSMINMKLKNAIRLDTVPLEKNIQKKPYYLKMVFTDTFINLANSTWIKKD